MLINFCHNLDNLHTLEQIQFYLKKQPLIFKIDWRLFAILTYRPSALQLYLKKAPAQVFPSEYCEIFMDSFFYTTPLVTGPVLWTITILNANRALENLRTANDFNFTKFFTKRVMACSAKGASYCCFRKAISNNVFQ